jgi:hypothetical protein
MSLRHVLIFLKDGSSATKMNFDVKLLTSANTVS